MACRLSRLAGNWPPGSDIPAPSGDVPLPVNGPVRANLGKSVASSQVYKVLPWLRPPLSVRTTPRGISAVEEQDRHLSSSASRFPPGPVAVDALVAAAIQQLTTLGTDSRGTVQLGSPGVRVSRPSSAIGRKQPAHPEERGLASTHRPRDAGDER